MSWLGKTYLKTDKPNVKIRLGLSFNRDLSNWATNEPKEIGYQVTATPVEVADLGNGAASETSGAFTGFWEIILPCGRKSKKREDTAWEEMKKAIPRYREHFENKGFKFIEDED